MRRTGRKKARTCPLGRLGISYLLVALTAALGWLYSSLPDHILLEPGQTLALPRFSYIQPLGSGGARNVVSTRDGGQLPGHPLDRRHISRQAGAGRGHPAAERHRLRHSLRGQDVLGGSADRGLYRPHRRLPAPRSTRPKPRGCAWATV